MRPKWPKLASLTQKICTLWFQFLVHSLLPREDLLKNIFTFNTQYSHQYATIIVSKFSFINHFYFITSSEFNAYQM